jgi:hypothetical protein
MSYVGDNQLGLGRGSRFIVLAALVFILGVLPLESCVAVYLIAQG